MAADLTYEGCNFFRQRLVLATLSGKSVKIKNIRAIEDDPGLKGTAVMQKLFFKTFGLRSKLNLPFNNFKNHFVQKILRLVLYGCSTS